MGMNRPRKSVCQTPVQKTTLLSFFERTPSSVNKQITCENDSKASFATPTGASQTPGSTSLIFRGRPRDVVCPACKNMVRYYDMNEHLDTDCVPTEILETKPILAKEEQRNSSAHVHVTNIISTAEQSQEILSEESSHQLMETVSSSVDVSPIQVKINKSNGTPIKVETLDVENGLRKLNRKWHTSPKKKNLSKLTTSFASDSKMTWAEKKTNNNFSVIKKRLTFQEFENSESPETVKKAKRIYAMPYYLETFLFLINSAFNEPLYKHLFIDVDSEVYTKFSSLSLDAKKLYVRLFSRKFQWRRRSKIVYDDIANDLSPLLNELCQSGFLLDISHLKELDVLLKLLHQHEIKELFKEMKIPFNGKVNAAEVISKHCRRQRSLINSAQSITDRIIAKIKRQFMSECYILNEDIRRIFLRFIMLSTLHHRQEDEEEKGQQHHSFIMLKVTIGEKSFPSYAIKRERRIFKDRDHFLRYGEAVMVESQVREFYDNKRWENLVELTNPVEVTLFDEHYKLYGVADAQLPLFLRRFTAGSVYVYIFNKRIEALQSLKMYKEAVNLLHKLIKQDTYLITHRGHWYERLALNVEQHLKDPSKAMEIIKDGLSDTWVTPSHKLALSQRATRISQSIKWRQKFEPFLKDLPILAPLEPRSIVITGRSLPRDLPGRKSVFIRGDSQVNMEDGDITLCSVEELVLQHYMENGYTHGTHGEGSTLWTVVGLLFWDVIYSSDVPDVFLSPFQIFPLDFDSPNFYESRREAIEKRLKAIRNWSSSEQVNQVASIWNENHGKTSLVSWDRFSDVESVGGLIECIPPNSLAAISERLLQNYRHFRSGFPDLTVWNPQQKKMRIVEVKGPNDRLSTKQILWLDFLVNLGLEAEVCYVEAVGTKKMGSTPQVTIRTKPRKSLEIDDSLVTAKANSGDLLENKQTLISPRKSAAMLESVELEATTSKLRDEKVTRKTKAPEDLDANEKIIIRSRRKKTKTDSA